MASMRCATFSCTWRKPRHDTAALGNTCNLDSQVKDQVSCHPKLALTGTEPWTSTSPAKRANHRGSAPLSYVSVIILDTYLLNVPRHTQWRMMILKDPHFSLDLSNLQLIVPCQ